VVVVSIPPVFAQPPEALATPVAATGPAVLLAKESCAVDWPSWYAPLVVVHEPADDVVLGKA
jgi:hypothetical protein